MMYDLVCYVNMLIIYLLCISIIFLFLHMKIILKIKKKIEFHKNIFLKLELNIKMIFKYCMQSMIKMYIQRNLIKFCYNKRDNEGEEKLNNIIIKINEVIIKYDIR